MFDILINFKDIKNAFHILKSSEDMKSFLIHLLSFVEISEIKDNFQVISNSHVYWDTL